MNKEDGGPAFPLGETVQCGSDGMSLRDYFAAKYMQGYMANPDLAFRERSEAATQAYLMADAMLEAR